MLFTLFVFLRIEVSSIYCLLFLFCFSSSCVTCVSSFSGLSSSICPLRFFLTFIIYIAYTSHTISKIVSLTLL